MTLGDVRSSIHQHPALPATVAEIGKIHFEGNIIPHPWYQQITLSGKADLPAIIILAEIVYWYRPYQLLDKRGKPLLRKRFDGDMFQCNAAYFEAKFGLTKNQVRKALKRLDDSGYIRREYRDIVQQGILRNNIMFIEPVPLMILAISHSTIPDASSPTTDTPSPTGDTLSPTGDTLSPTGDTLSPTGDTLSPTGDIIKGIKITTETSTETTTTTTTPNPSSTTERTAEPEPACGRGGAQDEKPENQNSAPEQTPQEPNKKKAVFQEEMINGQQAGLIYPAKLTATEQQDIEEQLQPLPPDIAQQMLDVIESKMQSGQIRTNPAALLRGVLRRYKANPDAFDPSSGFQIADTRRRRAETVAQREAARQESMRRGPAMREHRLSEFGRASIAAMRNALRGAQT